MGLIPEPKMHIGAITTEGEIEITFNQDMLAPNSVDQAVYKNVFRA